LTIPTKLDFVYPSLTGLTEQDVPLSILRLITRYILPIHYLAPNGRHDVGWHCSYCMSPEAIQNKLRSFLHVEFSGDEFTAFSNIYDAVVNCKDLFGRKRESFIRRPDDWELPIMAHTIEQCTATSIKDYLGHQ